METPREAVVESVDAIRLGAARNEVVSVRSPFGRDAKKRVRPLLKRRQRASMGIVIRTEQRPLADDFRGHRS